MPITEAQPVAASQRHEKRAVVLVSFAGLLASLTQSLLVPVLPKISADLGGGSGTQWLLTSTLLVGAVAVPVAGRLGDLYGKKPLLVIAAAALCVGSLISALSDSLAPMIAGRAVVGLSASALPLGISLLTTMLPAKRAASAVALVSAMLGVGGALGVPLAAWIGEYADYHVLFWVTMIGGAVSALATAFLLTEPPERAAGRLDVAGAVLLGAALVCLLLPLSQASSWGWASRSTISLLVAAAVITVVFVAWERRSTSPLVDIALNAKPSLLLVNIASTCVGFALYASFIGTAAYVEAPQSTGYGFGASVIVGGLCLLPSGVGMLLLSPVSAVMIDRVGPKITLAVGAAIVAMGFVVRIVLTDHLWQIILGTTIAGGGTGIAYAAMPALIALGAPRTELAAANGLNTLFRSVGSSLASAIGGTILASQVIVLADEVWPSLSAYRFLFVLCAVAALVGAVLSLMVPTVRQIDSAAASEGTRLASVGPDGTAVWAGPISTGDGRRAERSQTRAEIPLQDLS